MKKMVVARGGKIVFLILLLIGISVWGIYSFYQKPEILSVLPSPDEGSPYLVIHSKGDFFPERLANFLLSNPILIPGEGSAMLSFLPIVKNAETAALVLSASGVELSAWGAVSATKSEIKELSDCRIPAVWDLGGASLTVVESKDGKPSLYALTFGVKTEKLYLYISNQTVCFADTLDQIKNIRLMQQEGTKGTIPSWTLQPKWDTHMRFSEGGASDKEGLGRPLVFEIGLRPTDQVVTLSGDESLHFQGEVQWKVLGLTPRVSPAFTKSLKPIMWGDQGYSFLAPSLFSLGVNVPVLPKEITQWPAVLQIAKEQLDSIGFKESEVRSLLQGSIALDIGGKTRVLWLTLPGVTLQLANRKTLGLKLVDAFWEQFFMGAIPTPVDNFTRGGMTDLPFPIVAAARSDQVVLGTTELSGEEDNLLKYLLEHQARSIGWLYFDLPRLSDSVGEMTQISALFSEEEEADEEEAEKLEETQKIKNSLRGMPKVFINWEKADSGSALWFK